MLRGRNIWVKIDVLGNSGRETGFAQRNTRLWARNIFGRRPKFLLRAFFSPYIGVRLFLTMNIFDKYLVG